MKQSMVEVLQGRIEAMKEFDGSFIETVQGVLHEAEALGTELDPKELSKDKSVRAHIRKRTQKLNNLINRFKRDLNVIVTELQNEANE